MPNLALGLEKLVSPLLSALTDAWRQIVATGIATAVFMGFVCWLIDQRFTANAPPSALTGSLPIALDIKLLTLVVVAMTVTLAWLVAFLYSLYRKYRTTNV